MKKANEENIKIPDDMLKKYARLIAPTILEFYSTKEGQEYFEKYKENAKN